MLFRSLFPAAPRSAAGAASLCKKAAAVAARDPARSARHGVPREKGRVPRRRSAALRLASGVPFPAGLGRWVLIGECIGVLGMAEKGLHKGSWGSRGKGQRIFLKYVE